MKILHLSDLHLCSNYKRNNILKTKRMLRYFVDNNFDHLVITGDISDNSNPQDWILLKKMLQSFGIYENSKVTIIIGNHDIFGGVQTALDILSFPQKCNETNFKQKVLDFTSTFMELNSTNITQADNPYPFIKLIDDVAFLAINTIDYYGRFTNPFASNGKVSAIDYKHIQELLSLDDLKNKQLVVLTHHHFYKNNCEATSSAGTIWSKIEKFTMKLRGKKKLLKLFNKYAVKLVLHGHSHEIKQYERKDIAFVNAGGSIDNLSNTLSTAVIISVKTGKIDINFEDIIIKSKPVINSKPELLIETP